MEAARRSGCVLSSTIILRTAEMEASSWASLASGGSVDAWIRPVLPCMIDECEKEYEVSDERR